MTHVVEYENYGETSEPEIELEFTEDQWVFYQHYLLTRQAWEGYREEVEAVRTTVKFLHLGVLPSCGEETEGGNEGGCC